MDCAVPWHDLKGNEWSQSPPAAFVESDEPVPSGVSWQRNSASATVSVMKVEVMAHEPEYIEVVSSEYALGGGSGGSAVGIGVGAAVAANTKATPLADSVWVTEVKKEQ